ncbi:MAG: RES family NAD+ phosphorylase [Acidobacteria bacterium]|nr:RES family NAD+ phosphorylase [Acidobacteriota bacterium]
MPLPSNLPRLHLSVKAYRVVRKGRDPLATEWSLRNGGRYNPKDEFPALYVSLDEQTATAEKARNERLRGINPEEYAFGEWWAYEIAFDLESVLDLTDGKVLANLGVEKSNLQGQDRTLTHQIARDARASGFQALLVPSAATGGGKNLVIFTDTAHGEPRVLASRPVRLS